MQNWITALDDYNYYVDTSNFIIDNPELENEPLIGGAFDYEVAGGRESTILYEDRFRENAENSIAHWIELVYWKMYSQEGRRNGQTKRVLNYIRDANIQSDMLLEHSNNFLENTTLENFNAVRGCFGFVSPVIATVATVFAFLNPRLFPMVDTRIAKWAINQHELFNNNRPQNIVELTIPIAYSKTTTVLTTQDWDFYLNWIEWTRNVANYLNGEEKRTDFIWRPRDVEMAVFYAWGNRNQDHPIIDLTL